MTADLIDIDYERVLLVKPTVYVYKIPPITSASRGFLAADWSLAQPEWTGRMRLISKNDKLFLRIEDSSTGELYCQAPILTYPGPQIQPVTDSRRYFVVRVVNDASGRSALIGIGFGDGADSFDLTVALQDYFASLGKASESLDDDDGSKPKLDLSLKGDIRVNLNIGSNQGSKDRHKANKSQPACDPSKPFVLPPPPSSKRR